jgi:hypothetical protein
LKHERFHGFRTARCAAAGASPVATVRRPVGAKNGSTKSARLPLWRGLPASGAFSVPRSLFPVPRSRPCSALRTRNSCSRLTLRPRVSPGFRLPVPRPLFPVPRSRFPPFPLARVSPCFRFPVPCSPFPAFGSYPQRRMPIRPCKNHQIRVKIDQKDDVFRQKGIKKARVSSCPS